jgi:hypothetical protein
MDPAILFFVFGAAAGLMRSNLEIPPAISRFLSLYLLMALGLKGGFALAESGFTPQVLSSLGVAVGLAVLVPMLGYGVLRRWLNGFDAAAVAATYGSVSAVTFITAVHHLDNAGIAYGGHMPAAMALMESPAIVLAVLMANWVRTHNLAAREGAQVPPLKHVLHDALTDGAQLLLLGAMLVGWASGEAGRTAMQPFSADIFKGMLAYAVLGPICHAALALGLCWLLAIPQGDAALLMVLAASASYIAVPAVLRFAVPEANPSLYYGLSLGVTFPLNILLGIPAYTAVAQWVLP